MRLGLLSPTVAWTLARVQRCTQEKLLEILHRETFTSRQVSTLVGILAMANPATQERLLAHPHEALTGFQSQPQSEPPRDLRLGTIAAELDRQIHLVLNLSGRLSTMLDRTDFLALKKTERSILEQGLQILWRQLVELQRTMRSKLSPASPTSAATADPNAPDLRQPSRPRKPRHPPASRN